MPPIPEPMMTPMRSGSTARQIESRVVDGLVGGDDRELDEAVHPLRVLAVDHAFGR